MKLSRKVSYTHAAHPLFGGYSLCNTARDHRGGARMADLGQRVTCLDCLKVLEACRGYNEAGVLLVGRA